MIILKILIIAIIGATSSVLLKQVKPEFSIYVIIATGIILVLEVFGYLTSIVEVFENLGNISGIDDDMLKIILKIIGFGYLIEFASSLCLDAGLASISSKIQFAGKVIILFISLPIINSLIEIIISILKLC